MIKESPPVRPPDDRHAKTGVGRLLFPHCEI